MSIMTLLLLVLLCFSHLLLLLVANAANYHSSSSSLELSVGLSFSPLDMSITTVAIPGFNDTSFLPILNSPSFNSSNSSQSPGFSFGFLFIPHFSVNVTICLAVCGGISGNLSNNSEYSYSIGMPHNEFFIINQTEDGYAVPVWMANPSTPLASFNASLVVVEVANTKAQLQLKDYNGTLLWNVSNVGHMEMHDTGTLTIHDPSNTTHVVFESPRDTLLAGEKFTVGMQLTSSDDSYSARMEEGGLVLYANKIQFNMVAQPAAYWAITALLSLQDNLFNVRNKVMSSPCSPGINDTAYAIFDWANTEMHLLNTGPCSNSWLEISSSLTTHSQLEKSGPSSFVKLQTDGWLRSYLVDPSDLGQSPSILPIWDYLYGSNVSIDSPYPILQVTIWDSCFVPLACGRLGVCTPYADSSCSCPAPMGAFQPTDKNNLHKGCTRVTPLPECSTSKDAGHVNTTQFIQLNHTASVFLFSGLGLFSSSPQLKDVETCKSSCSSNCSCNGFFFQAKVSACFFITDEISLLNLTSDIITNITRISKFDNDVVPWPVHILQSDYVTYLKVTAADQTSSPIGLGKSSVIAIAVASFVAACVGLGLVMLLLHARAAKRRLLSKQARQAAMEEELREVLPLLPTRFSYRDLHEATNGFTKLLGEGGCGSVYAGVLHDGRKVAVKTLDFVMKGELSKQFLAEVATIGQTSHHNIVRLIGFCWEVSNRLLVYEYMERGSLDHWLFHKPSTDDERVVPLLDWQTRYNVVLGIARGLNYLHEECPQPILHFDIKPQNILLDVDFVAKLADFGMSKLMQRDVSKVVTGVRGTPGYIAPEWFMHGAVSKKSDIYSMGMVILEMVGGRKILDLELLNYDNDAVNVYDDSTTSGLVSQHEEWHFPSWAARRCEEGLEMELVDKRLRGAFNEEQARKLINIAFWCIQEDARMRPHVSTVLKWLGCSSPVKRPPFSSAAYSKPSSLSIASSSSLQLENDH